MIDRGVLQQMVKASLSQGRSIEAIDSTILPIGRGGNTKAAFRHDVTYDDGDVVSVFHKELKSEHLYMKAGGGGISNSFPDPELVVANSVLEFGPLPVPTPLALARSGRHVFYRYVPASLVEAEPDLILQLAKFAAHINSYGALSSENTELPDHVFFADSNPAEAVSALLEDDIIKTHFGAEEALSIKLLYDKWDCVAAHVPKVFSHGDLYLHNSTIYNGEMWIFDWGSAGFYPVGFDLGECVTHGKLVDQTRFKADIMCEAYLRMLGRSEIKLSDVYYGLQFSIFKWLLPNHLKNIIRFHRKQDHGMVAHLVSVARSCLLVAHECAELLA